MDRPNQKLGKIQLKIMQILWQNGSATAREITDELAPTENLAHSTVQTLLRKLEVKGAVTHEQRDRTFYFTPLYRREDVTESATTDLLNRVFHGSVYGLVSHLLKNERISEDEMSRIRALIDTDKEARR
ncbi:MAG: BlaI/MecI/CopY family transcriptional regulator [Chthonomonadales bacterium]